jgi:hypothetical protein
VDSEAGGMSKSPNVALEDGIGLDLEDGHISCRGLSERGEGVGNRHWVCRLRFLIGRFSLSTKTTSAIYPIFSPYAEKDGSTRHPLIKLFGGHVHRDYARPRQVIESIFTTHFPEWSRSHDQTTDTAKGIPNRPLSSWK